MLVASSDIRVLVVPFCFGAVTVFWSFVVSLMDTLYLMFVLKVVKNGKK